jgi:RimJ/RimL family protein N-acetyltransferase
MIFQTDKLLFRAWTLDDIDHAVTLWGDPEVMKYLDARGGLSKNLVEQRLKQEIDRQEKSGLQYWMVFEQSTGDFVGCCGLKPWTWSPNPGTEMGFYLPKSKWGKGFGKSMAHAVVLYAREKLGLNKLLSGHHPDNHASKKILTGLGFRFTEDLFFKPTGLMHPCYELDLAVRSVGLEKP